MESRQNILILSVFFTSLLMWTSWQSFQQKKNIDIRKEKQEITKQSNTYPSNNNSLIQTETNDAIKKSTQLINVETDNLLVKINPIGGDIIFASLKKYKKEINSDKNLIILQEDQANNFVYYAQSGLIGINGIDSNKKRAVYNFKSTEYKMMDDQQELNVDLNFEQDNIKYTKRYKFHKNKHNIKVSYIIENKSQNNAIVEMYNQIKQSINKEESSNMFMPTYRGAAYSSEDIRFQKYSFEDIQEKNLELSSKKGWISMIQHYFVTAWVPEKQKSFNIYTRNIQDSTAIIGFKSKQEVIAANSKKIISSDLYIGPKTQKELAELADNLNLVVDYGFLWWLAVPIHKALMYSQKLTINWGLAIILITLLIRLLMFPLTKAQHVSMAKTKKIQPKIEKLKQRYGEDKNKLGQAMIELYQKEKVNPIGGCLPIILQMPIFLALYWVLLESVELRHAPFVFWIQDLSVQDPFYILPILMGASMLVMQKMQPSPASLDENQKKVMQIMPLIFTVFFLWFPSGLVLYWLISNIATIIQQSIIFKKIGK